MQEERAERRLAAILAADVVGFSRLMENDEVEKVIHNAFFEEQVLGQYGIKIRNIFDTLHASPSKAVMAIITTKMNVRRPLSQRMLAFID